MQKKTEEFTSTLDYADIISDSTERYIYTQNKTLFQKTNARVIFATVSDTGDESPYNCAKELYEKASAEIAVLKAELEAKIKASIEATEEDSLDAASLDDEDDDLDIRLLDLDGDLDE